MKNSVSTTQRLHEEIGDILIELDEDEHDSQGQGGKDILDQVDEYAEEEEEDVLDQVEDYTKEEDDNEEAHKELANPTQNSKQLGTSIACTSETGSSRGCPRVAYPEWTSQITEKKLGHIALQYSIKLKLR